MIKSIKKSIIIVMAVVLLFVLASCAIAENNPKPKSTPVQTTDDTEYPLTITDTQGNKFKVEKEPEKIITIGPNLTETVYALGKGDKLIGRTDYDDYPNQVSEVESIGDLMTPNVEKVIDLDADIVLVSGTVMPDYINQMRQNSVPVFVIDDQSSFEGVYDTILMIGNILNANSKASEIVEDMKGKVADVTNKVNDLEKPTVYYVVGYGEYGDYTATGDTFISFLLEMAGGDNIAKNEQGWSYSKEALIEKDPELIICSDRWDTKQGFMSTPGYEDLTAVKEGKVFELDENIITRQGPRLADGLLELAKILHPEAFN
ncbi:MAG TPA: ABC transporter substrate-binding protein [Clostridia bacterium]|jgi:iron complex transport system substrate-binding protein|nr:ABC transporter substrate-binding protein [Clostridiaceae bacterium]HOA31314.1 ABC transporter substrate-binding protein [Clostridia bacterium]HPZ51996.1 ABC transporter substrate-binding protein [Clostridia bacterium]